MVLPADHATEILVDGVKGIRLKFAENPPQLLFDPVYLVEETAAVDFQLAAAQFPVRAQKKMVFEQGVLGIVKLPCTLCTVSQVVMLESSVSPCR